MSKEFQIRDGNLIASFDLENGDGDIDFCKLLKVSQGVVEEIVMFVDYVATNKIIKDQSKKIADLEAKLAESEETIKNNSHNKWLKAEAERYKNEYQSLKGYVDQLKQQLAESERQIKDAREARDMAVDSWCKNRRKYEAQIAEMQNTSFILYSMLYETLEKQGCEDIASQIDQMTGWTYDKEADWLKENRNYDQLKHQLKMTNKALELACSEELREIGIYNDDLDYKKEMLITKQQYLEQAEKDV